MRHLRAFVRPTHRLILGITGITGLTLALASGCANSDFAGTSGKRGGTEKDEAKDEQDDDTDADTKKRGEKDSDRDSDASKGGELDEDGDDVLLDEGLACDKGKSGLVGKLYKLPPETGQLPDFSTLTPLGQVDATKLDVPEREWTEGFPGVPDLDEWFAIEFFASLAVPKDGTYKFRTHSDDGSKLYIDGSVVVDNDGKHAPSSKDGSKELTKGKHKLRISWFQGPRTRIALQVYWTTPDGTEEIIPTSALTRNKDCDLTDLGKFE